MRKVATLCILFLTFTCNAQYSHGIITNVGLGISSHEFTMPDSVASVFNRPRIKGGRVPIQILYPIRFISVGINFAWTDLHFAELYGSTTKRNLIETGLIASSTFNITVLRSQVNVYGGFGYARLLNRDVNQPHEYTRANGTVFSFGVVPTFYFTNEYRAGINFWFNYSSFNFKNTQTVSDFTSGTNRYSSKGSAWSAGLGFVYRFDFCKKSHSKPNSDPLQ